MFLVVQYLEFSIEMCFGIWISETISMGNIMLTILNATLNKQFFIWVLFIKRLNRNKSRTRVFIGITLRGICGDLVLCNRRTCNKKNSLLNSN